MKLILTQAEVLGKRVVVQHLPLGGLLEWNVTSTLDGTDETIRGEGPSQAN